MSKIYLRQYINLAALTWILFSASLFFAVIFYSFHFTGSGQGQPEITKPTGKKIIETVSADKFIIDKKRFSYLPDVSITPAEFVRKYTMFNLTNDQSIMLPAGNYIFTNPVTIPNNTRLTIAAGTTITLNDDAVLLSYSPIIARGASDAPIRFFGDGGKGGNVVVVNTNNNRFGSSFFEYAEFRGGGEGSQNGVFFSGMLALQHSDGIIRNSLFVNARGDDALNIKYASSTVAYNTFRNNAADAIDYDFSSGVIEHNRFIDNGNDGIDTSGSRVLIQHNDILRSGDKCLSIGERSAPVIFNNILDGCKTGIESKDLSTPVIINNVIINNATGINAYQKKDIFGGGRAEVYNSILWGNATATAHDAVSTIAVKNSAVEGGYEGAGNFTHKPKFENEQGRNFTNSGFDDSMKYLDGGDVRVLKEYLDIGVDKAPVGLLNQIVIPEQHRESRQ